MIRKVLFFIFFSTIVLSGAEFKDIPYYGKNSPVRGDADYRNKMCRLDLKLPDDRVNYPTLIYFHGGGLVAGAKKFFPVINSELVGFAAVDYRLSGKNAKCPDYLYDAAAAVAWVIKNIKKYGGDPAKVYVSGQSAGGYLAAMIALDKRYLAEFGISPKQLAGVFPISGQMSTHFQILNERRAKDPAVRDFAIDGYAPLYYAAKDTPPMTMFTGDPELDWPARVEENRLLAMRMRRVYKNENVECYSIPGTGHSGCVQPSLAIINSILSRISKKSSQLKK